MRKYNFLAVGLLATFLPPALALADEVQVTTETIDGVDYRVTRRVVARPMSKTEIVERQRDVYREEYVTDMQETTRIVQVPITEYRWEAEWRNRWNPFSPPYMVQRLVPRTHWETRSEIVKVPVTQRTLVPETRIERVPVTERWMGKEEIVSKVALQPIEGLNSPASIARRSSVGGVSKLESDPPRGGTTVRR